MSVTKADIKTFFTAPNDQIGKLEFDFLLEEHKENGFSDDVSEPLANAFKGYLYCEPGDEAAKHAYECAAILDISLEHLE